MAPGLQLTASDPTPLWRQVLYLGERLLAPSDPDAPLHETLLQQRQIIEETAMRLVPGQALLWLSDELQPGFAVRHARRSPPPPTPLMQQARATRRVCCSPDAGAPGTESPECSPEASAAAAPLLAEDQSTVLGVLQIERLEGSPFTPLELNLLDGLAVQASLALQADRKTAIERWRIQQLALVRKVSAQVADVRDLDELARQVTHLILETFGYYYVAVFTLEPGQDVLHFRDSAGPLRRNKGRLASPGGILETDSTAAGEPPSNGGHLPSPESLPAPAGPETGLSAGPPAPTVDDFSPALTVHLGQGIIGQAAQTGVEILAADVTTDERYLFYDSLPETRSEVALPLKIEDRVLGVLDVQSDEPHGFHETDLLVLRALADNIAIAVEEARLYGALRRRAEQLSAVFEVSNAITSILDLDQLLEEVVNLIHNRFGYPWVHLFTVHPGRRKVFYEAGSGSLSQYFRQQRYMVDLDDPQGLISWVARQGDTLLVNDVLTEPRYRPSPLPPDEVRSEIVVPLVFGGQVLGVLDVESDQVNAFGEEDRFLFEALADNVAVALRNANLYRSEKWRRQVADSLREVAGLLSADADLEHVLEIILVELQRTLPCDVAAIWLLDEDGVEALPEESDPAAQLRLAAISGPGAAGLALEKGLSLAEVIQNHAPNPEDEMVTADGAAWLGQALMAEEPLIRLPGASPDPLGEGLGFPDDYSAIATPLRVGEQRLGVLTLIHHTSGRYGTESRLMTAAFASYAAVAIENTRLYEAAHEQAWIATVLLQVTEATQSITNLNELLATVTRITPMLVGVKACALYMLDETGSFVPAAAAGLSTEQQVEFERWRFAPGDVPALDRLVEERMPMILQDENEDARLADIILSGPDPETLFEAEILVLVPLMTRGDLLGVFVIDYSSEGSGPGTADPLSEHMEALFDERLAILQGIAHQTAVAVENIRLLKSQKEEAYVSVALLQVAQAVVSSNELEETLGAIVRITPILVGVKRSLLFLWEPEQNAFCLSQSYGINREAEGTLYPPGTFPLLDAVSSTNQIVVHPLNAFADEPSEAPAAWADFLPPEAEDMEAYMDGDVCLLLAFPLAVKNDLLGVLMVEEPDPVPAENLSGRQNRRLREKRMEIITGISQQAALAIQNDHLQREMVERERLEREMQLARQIQRTFMPNQVPELSGWELRVLWRTAREVGGDFYDYFDLPGSRLGIVIADVADKGMPAALFMTLVRTLVRATTREMDSPAEVLQRVNDLLVPDAQQGMFVTLAYAVLDLDTGHLSYANAGHNPPLLWRSQNQSVERLERSGMALGVQSGSQLIEHALELEPGDALVMYTDGVTEAFSPEGEMFGDQGLRHTLKKVAQQPDFSAPILLAAINDTVSEFTRQSTLADDLTLIVIRRAPTSSPAESSSPS